MQIFFPFLFQKEFGRAFRVLSDKVKEKIKGVGKIRVEQDEARSIVTVRMHAQKSYMCIIARGCTFVSGLLVPSVQKRT